MARMSSSLRKTYSFSSTLISEPEYLPKMIRSPVFTEIGTTLPFFSVRPDPTAITFPSCGFSCAASGRYNPPFERSTEPRRWTITLSPIGLGFSAVCGAVAVAVAMDGMLLDLVHVSAAVTPRPARRHLVFVFLRQLGHHGFGG